MIVKTNNMIEGEKAFDIYDFGFGEGFHCVTVPQLKALKREIEEALEAND